MSMPLFLGVIIHFYSWTNFLLYSKTCLINHFLFLLYYSASCLFLALQLHYTDKSTKDILGTILFISFSSSFEINLQFPGLPLHILLVPKPTAVGFLNHQSDISILLRPAVTISLSPSCKFYN